MALDAIITLGHETQMDVVGHGMESLLLNNIHAQKMLGVASIIALGFRLSKTTSGVACP